MDKSNNSRSRDLSVPTIQGVGDLPQSAIRLLTTLTLPKIPNFSSPPSLITLTTYFYNKIFKKPKL